MIRDIQHVEQHRLRQQGPGAADPAQAPRRASRTSPRTCPATRCRRPTGSSSTIPATSASSRTASSRAAAERQAAADQPGDRRDQGPRGRHQEDPLRDQHDQAPARCARGPAGARVGPAGGEHDPPVDLRPPARGRGDAAGRRDQLVHPLAVRDRGPDRRLPRGRSSPSLLLWVAKVTVVDPWSDRFALIAAPQTIDFTLLVLLLLAAGTAVSALGSGPHAAPLPAGLGHRSPERRPRGGRSLRSVCARRARCDR